MQSANPPLVIENGSQSRHPLIPQLRSASRSLVREFGYMSSTFADTNLPSSAIHALIEIQSASSHTHSLSSDLSKNSNIKGHKAKTHGITASALCTALNLEKSSVSRMLRKLIDSGEIEEGYSGHDGREKVLSLTMKGRETVKKVDVIGDEQVARALRMLPSPGKGSSNGTATNPEVVLKGISAYANAMRKARLGEHTADALLSPSTSSEKSQENGNGNDNGTIFIKEGYIPGLTGRVISMQMSVYSPLVNLSSFFEALLASHLAELLPRLDGRRAQVWTAVDARGGIQGSLFIDTESKILHDEASESREGSSEVEEEELGTAPAKTPIALFRALVIDESIKGRGIGKVLVDKAMRWVDERGLECHLWTFKELEAARRVYDRNGFVVVEEGWNGMLGPQLWMQKMVRPGRKGLGDDVVMAGVER